MAELVLALDLPTGEAALGLLDRIPDARWVKLGSVLFTATGPALVDTLKRRGHRVFLDLKWHDIPNTVHGAVSRAREIGVDMVTVHALGGPAMLAAASEAAAGQVKVVAVTVLTSHSLPELSAVLGRPIEAVQPEVIRLASAARAAGVDGVVSSPLETAALRAALGPDALLVTPGIRAAGDEKGDQARTASARDAARAGSTHLVVGRPVLNAANPASAWAALRERLG